MKITAIHIDGFGVWHDLTLTDLSPELTVLHGPNEAGKSTLMQFLRSVLYGMSERRRKRYLPPFAGGRPGGSLTVLDDEGEFLIQRYADRGPNDTGKVEVFTPAGQPQGDRLLRDALEHIDEATYNNLFAVGLGEIQELATLSDTAAAQWLYRLTSGLDRISLYDVIHLLRGSLARLLADPAEPSEIGRLVARRDIVESELQELIVKGRNWTQTAVRLTELAEQIDRLQGDAKETRSTARRLETAIQLKPLWVKRDRLTEELHEYDGLYQLPQGALDELDELNDRIEEHQRQRDILKGQRHQLRDEAEALGINEMLARSAERLEALAEQQEWLEGLERQAAELEAEVETMDERIAGDRERLADRWFSDTGVIPEITQDTVEQLQPQATALEATERLLADTQTELQAHHEGEHELRAMLKAARSDGDQMGLPGNIDEASELVARLRRRQQLEQRVEHARRHIGELEDQAQDLLEEQMIPMWMFGGLLLVIMAGFLLLGIWLWAPDLIGPNGGYFAALGVAGAFVAALVKISLERSAASRLEACQRQTEITRQQIEEAREEQTDLDGELPIAEGSATMRLQHAERHLTELEKILPVESQRRAAEEQIEGAQRRLKVAEEKHKAAVANWRNKMKGLGLPEDLTPDNLRLLADQYERLSDSEQRMASRREEVERRHREFTMVSKRIQRLAEETSLVDEQATPLEQLQYMLETYREQKLKLAHRGELRERAKELKAEELRHARAAVGLTRRREAVFQTAGVDSEKAYRELAAALAKAAELTQKRAALTREIAAAIGRNASEQDFAELLDPESIGSLETNWASLETKLEKIEAELKQVIEQRGRLIEQQRLAAADRALAEKQMELDTIDEQLRLARRMWRERAMVSFVLERIREDYERNRQPETLVEASKYMSQLTSGRYRRVWTPLANDILLVETADGQSLPVEVLSRGTREQLFVSLRLALVATYARRGIQLPMILDDVFVNFDAGRSKICVQVLKEFAAEGHQMIVFTCHEHVWNMFRNVHADARRLPNRFADDSLEEVGPEAEIEAAIEMEAGPQPEPELAPEGAAARRPKPQAEPVPELELAEAEEVEEVEEVAELNEAVEEALADDEAEAEVAEAEPLPEYEYGEVAPPPRPEPTWSPAPPTDALVEVEYHWEERAVRSPHERINA